MGKFLLELLIRLSLGVYRNEQKEHVGLTEAHFEKTIYLNVINSNQSSTV